MSKIFSFLFSLKFLEYSFEDKDSRLRGNICCFQGLSIHLYIPPLYSTLKYRNSTVKSLRIARSIKHKTIPFESFISVSLFVPNFPHLPFERKLNSAEKVSRRVSLSAKINLPGIPRFSSPPSSQRESASVNADFIPRPLSPHIRISCNRMCASLRTRALPHITNFSNSFLSFRYD